MSNILNRAGFVVECLSFTCKEEKKKTAEMASFPARSQIKVIPTLKNSEIGIDDNIEASFLGKGSQKVVALTYTWV